MTLTEEQQKQEKKSLRRWLKILRREVPPIHPVRVHRINQDTDFWGACDLRQTRYGDWVFHIELDDRLQSAGLYHVLLHEWAHALSWQSDHPNFPEHSPEWAIAFARCYDAIERDYDRRNPDRKSN